MKYSYSKDIESNFLDTENKDIFLLAKKVDKLLQSAFNKIK